MQRFRDWLHEHEIERLSTACKEAYAAGDKAKASHFFQQMRRAINARSPEQVERMELRIGLRARTTIKRSVMDAFLRGAVPAWAVVLVFRLFKLRRL